MERCRARTATLMGLVSVLAGLGGLPAGAAALTEVTGFGSNPGNLRMFRYVPDTLRPTPALVVALHGCVQTAAAYDDETGWTRLADAHGFALLLPEQQPVNNALSCFNWFEPGDNARGAGEALSIAQMVQRMKADHGVHPARVYVTGLSAGGAMTAVMLAAYPEVYAGGAPLAGIPYRCASTSTEGFSCASPGRDLTPAQWGDRVRAAVPGYTGPRPKVSIWQGDADTAVRPMNASELVEQWTNVHGIDQVPDLQDTVKGHVHRVYRDAAGEARVELYLVGGLRHGTPIDPGPAPDQCGTVGAYVLDADICSSYFIARVWGLDRNDSQPPAVALVTPQDGAVVQGHVSVEAEASDDTGVVRAEFFLDGALLGTDVAPPWALDWDAATAVNGAHTLRPEALDAAGNRGRSATIDVTVIGGVEDVTPPVAALVAPPAGATLHGQVPLRARATDDFGVARVEFLVDGAVLGPGTRTGPEHWELAWDSHGVADGPHLLAARAFDAAGNEGRSADVAVTVDQQAAALVETFSDADGNGDLFDTAGWSADGWTASTENHGAPGSRSAFGLASSGLGCATGTRTRLLSRDVTLGAHPRLSYARKLDLRAAVNLFTRAAFSVRVGGQVVDERAAVFASVRETSWTERVVDLAAFAGQSVRLELLVSASSNVCLEVSARAWVDALEIR